MVKVTGISLLVSSLLWGCTHSSAGVRRKPREAIMLEEHKRKPVDITSVRPTPLIGGVGSNENESRDEYFLPPHSNQLTIT